ncbi:MAG: MBL fold metallo-hydrolase [Pseudomonadota bacterium]
MKQALNFTTETIPGPDELVSVTDGIQWLRLPLPFALNHVNVWLLADGVAGHTVIDTGLNTDQNRNQWDSLLRHGAMKDEVINRVLVTHFHPDHMGLAGWLCERFSVPLWAPRADWMKARILSCDDSDRLTAAGVEFYRRLGVSTQALLNIAQRGNLYTLGVSPVPRSYRRLVDQEIITIGDTDWRVITTPGHAPEMACLYAPTRNILIAADHILPEISPNVSVWGDEPDANPLQEFRQSLAKVKQLVPADCLVLPSHGRPFYGLHDRIDWLDHHHDERLAETLKACATPVTGKDVMVQLFARRLDAQQWGFAMGETVAHLNYLIATGQITKKEDADGILFFEAI